MKKAHGTPAEFSKSVSEAFVAGMISADEAEKGYRRYLNEWIAAPEKAT